MFFCLRHANNRCIPAYKVIHGHSQRVPLLSDSNCFEHAGAPQLHAYVVRIKLMGWKIWVWFYASYISRTRLLQRQNQFIKLEPKLIWKSISLNISHTPSLIELSHLIISLGLLNRWLLLDSKFLNHTEFGLFQNQVDLIICGVSVFLYEAMYVVFHVSCVMFDDEVLWAELFGSTVVLIILQLIITLLQQILITSFHHTLLIHQLKQW